MQIGVEPQIDPEIEEDKAALSSYKVKLDVFEGPFDLLLAMVDKGDIDLYKVSLTQITSGFMDYIKTLEKLNIVIAGEFLLMAAYLLEMKSKMLLPEAPTANEEEDLLNVEEELLERLAEYKLYKGLAQSLKERKDVFQRVYARYKPQEALEDREIFLVEVSMKDLVSAFKRIWDKAESRGKTEEIVAESISVKDKISEILSKVSGTEEGISFNSLFTRFSKIEIIVTFLAILELIRQKLIRILQNETFGDICLYAGEGAK
ncbi:MAG: segregation/condensation protein A [bacterium]